MSTNYPSAIDDFIAKIDNTDDVIAAHINNLQDAVAALQTKLGTNSSAATTSFDYFLKHSSGVFRNHTHAGTSDDGLKIPMSSLSEVTLAGLLNYQLLRWNSTTSMWVNSTITLSYNSDISFGSLTNGEVIMYNSSAAKWTNQSLSSYALLATTQTFTGMKTFSGGLVIENRTSDPTSPVTGQIWFRTDI